MEGWVPPAVNLLSGKLFLSQDCVTIQPMLCLGFVPCCLPITTQSSLTAEQGKSQNPDPFLQPFHPTAWRMGVDKAGGGH